MGDESFVPRQYLGVMVSSTFRDLEQHRGALMRAIEGQGLHAVAMERDSARPSGTVIDSSLEKVREAAAYIGVISHRYGEVPDSTEHNPDGRSLTELEFREARRLGRPILIFIMGSDHDVKVGDVERNPEKLDKLQGFREDVKRASAESTVQRVYKEFNSLPEFAAAATQSVAELRALLDAQNSSAAPAPPPATAGQGDSDGIPRPPALYADPRYIGSHAFVGRAVELEKLCDWAVPAEPHPVLLYEAIGGAGKSMLTWEWMVSYARGARTDWAGQFWYSFYERGAVMADFCRRALAYMTGQPLRSFRKKRQPELTRLLLRQLQQRPWLVVLDGLERVLVAYHRYDAAQIADEQAGRTDEIGHRDPSAAIRPQDDELLRSLVVATPSKVLITSRLVPQALLNRTGQPMPGVLYERLAGLRPPDAEALVRACGVRGDSQVIRSYLQQHCDCHPLVTGIVAGLVNDYLPERGQFDAWASDPAQGGRLNLAELDLVQKRNHILKSALDGLPGECRQLVSTLALLSEAVDYDTLTALNPHLPREHQEPPEPENPEAWLLWQGMSPAEREEVAKQYAYDRARYAELERKHRSWLASGGPQRAAGQLADTVRDLERRGLLQYDWQANRYDLHPVVRGYASGSLRAEDRDRYGRLAIDYFSQRPRDLYEQAETLDDVRYALQLFRAFLQTGQMQSACAFYRGDLSNALLFNLEASAEILSLLRPFFTEDWTAPSDNFDTLDRLDFSYLATNAAISFERLGQLERALGINMAALRVDIDIMSPQYLMSDLMHIAGIFSLQGYLAGWGRCAQLAINLAESMHSDEDSFCARLERFRQLAEIGRWADAEAIWQALDLMGRDWLRAVYRPGMAEEAYAWSQFWQGCLNEDVLAQAEYLALSGRNRPSTRALHALRGEWRLERGEWALAVESLHEAIRMTREVGISDMPLEARLALAQFRLGQLPAARDEAIRLSGNHRPAHLALAELWHAIGDPAQAAEHALAAYRWAWADGEPYVRRYELGRVTALLQQLGVEVPELPAYDSAQDQPLDFEDDVRAFIAEIRAMHERGQTELEPDGP